MRLNFGEFGGKGLLRSDGLRGELAEGHACKDVVAVGLRKEGEHAPSFSDTIFALLLHGKTDSKELSENNPANARKQPIDGRNANPEAPTVPISKLPGPLGSLDPKLLLEVGVRTSPHTTARNSWLPPMPEDLDFRLPAYEITEFIGRGGMGAVYRGLQLSLHREVALKILPPEVAEAPTFPNRFKREAIAMAALRHPNIVTIYEFGELPPSSPGPGGDASEGSSYFFTMEYVDGTDLHRLIRSGTATEEMALRIMSQVCEALCYAHEKGYIHRDIKPANIFLTKDGDVKVGDFGLAKLIGDQETLASDPSITLTMTGHALGSAFYMAPELLSQGAKVDHRADIYALGIMLYELLTGEVPRGMFKMPSERSGTNPKLDTIIGKALEQDPDDRYPTTRKLQNDIHSAEGNDRSSMKKGGRVLMSLLVLLPILAVVIGVPLNIRKTTSAPRLLEYQQRPTLPLPLPDGGGRIVVIPSDRINSVAFPAWTYGISHGNRDDIVSLELTPDNHILALAADGTVHFTNTSQEGTETDGPQDEAEVPDYPILDLSNVARITPRLDLALDQDGGGFDPSVFGENPPEKLVAIDGCPETAVGISPDGRVHFGNGEGDRFHREFLGDITDAIDVSVGEKPYRCFILREGGKWSWTLNGDKKGGDLFFTGKDCAVLCGLPRGYLDSKGVLNTLGRRYGQQELLAHISPHGPYIEEIGAADNAYTISLKKPDGSVRVFHKSHFPHQMSHLEPLLRDAIRVISFAAEGVDPRRGSHIIAVLPPDKVPRSGYWDPAELANVLGLEEAPPLNSGELEEPEKAPVSRVVQ